jgi:hypothetical protein
MVLSKNRGWVGTLPRNGSLSYMATVTWINGWRVFINSNDHKPAHVHVEGNGVEAVFNLNCPHGPVRLRTNHGVPLHGVTWLVRQLSAPANMALMCGKWSVMHGNFI